MTKDVLAGMKVLTLRCIKEQKDRLLKLYPEVKFDSASTKSIELLPAETKDGMFDLAIKIGLRHSCKKHVPIWAESLVSTKEGDSSCNRAGGILSERKRSGEI